MAFIHSWKLLKWVCIKAASHVAALVAHPRRSPLALPRPHFPNQVHWKMCFIFGRNFSPTSTPAPISVAFSLFLRFYNKLDLRKNRSPFISGGLMVSRRAAHNKKNTPSRVGREWAVGQGIQMTAGGPTSAFLWSPIAGWDFATLRLSSASLDTCYTMNK